MSAFVALFCLWLASEPRALYRTTRAVAAVKARISPPLADDNSSYYLHDHQHLNGKRHQLASCGVSECAPCRQSASRPSPGYVRWPLPTLPRVTNEMLTPREPAPITDAHRFFPADMTVEGPRPYTAGLVVAVTAAS